MVLKSYQYPCYTEEEHRIWERLLQTQKANIKIYAHPLCCQCIEELDMSSQNIPNLMTISQKLTMSTGWSVIKADGMLDFDTYYLALSRRQFPSTTYIRRPEEFLISERPDIFHELFGHCAILMNSDYADFLEKIGQFAMTLDIDERVYLLRLVWYTTEVGLVQRPNQEGVSVYGASVLSSIKEIAYAAESTNSKKLTFSLHDVLRTPYNYAKLQKHYYVINDFTELYDLVSDLIFLKESIKEAKSLADFNLKELEATLS